LATSRSQPDITGEPRPVKQRPVERPGSGKQPVLLRQSASAGGAAIVPPRATPAMSGANAAPAAAVPHAQHRQDAVMATGTGGPDAAEQPQRPEPLEGHPRYAKLRDLNR